MTIKKRALLSVSDKSELVPFAKGLVDLGYELVSTGGTLAALTEAGIEAVSISDVTGFPEIMDGRVKTLHPTVFAGILARRQRQDDLDTLAEKAIGLIDLVAVNLYPFRQTVAQSPEEFDACLEKIDIGGPSLLRAAAKSFRDVLVVVDPMDYTTVLEMSNEAAGVSLEIRQRLAVKVFQHTSSYDASIANYLAETAAPEVIGSSVESDEVMKGSVLPAQFFVSVPRVTTLRYGENPHQNAALYADDQTEEISVATARQLQGKELSYNNLNDGEGALELVRELAYHLGSGDKAAVAITKHTNPCGAALGSSVKEAYQTALACDPISAFGSIIAVSHEVDEAAAEAMKSLFIEAIIAPSFSAEALSIFSRKKNLRLLETGEVPGKMLARRSIKNIVGGYLIQSLDRKPGDFEWNVVTEKQPDEADKHGLEFAWIVAKSVKSNAIVYTSANATLGIGAGQMSRVDAARIGAEKAAEAKLSLDGSYLGSDAFFPFRDGVDVAAKAGVKAIIQPGGSKKDEETIAAANEHGICMVFTGQRHFRH
jgi:phosphoribosylaminoimidazolecarboxamide formyltransferase/IMP cyclohydrolase